MSLPFVYQAPPTAEDTFDAYLYSSKLGLPASLLAANSALNLGFGMVSYLYPSTSSLHI